MSESETKVDDDTGTPNLAVIQLRLAEIERRLATIEKALTPITELVTRWGPKLNKYGRFLG